MYKYLWSRKGEEGEEETETNGNSRQHFRLFGRRKIIRKFVVPSATFASLNTHAQVKMHNRQLKWKLTHELVSHSSHFHLEHQQQAHSTGEIVHKLSTQQNRVWQRQQRQLEQEWEAAAEIGSRSRNGNGNGNGSHCRHSQIRAQSANQDHSNALPIVCPAKQTTWLFALPFLLSPSSSCRRICVQINCNLGKL